MGSQTLSVACSHSAVTDLD